MDFRFTTEETFRRTDEIVDYLLGPRLWVPCLDYPDYDVWVQKVHRQLKEAKKRSLLAISYGNIIGAIIYQFHELEPEVLEIKNISVRPDQQGRYVASFLLRNAEIKGCADFSSRAIVVDAKAKNLAIRSFYSRMGMFLLRFGTCMV
jgi:ribosomal protein S18 acetylase RimI-like enzyme